VTESIIVPAARERGAAFIEIDGRTVPASFGDPAAEYRALREGAGLADVAGDDRLRVTGTDRIDFLQGMLSNDVRGLTPGGGCHTLLLTDQGRVVADLVALALADAMLLDGAAEGIRGAMAALERYIVADDVELARVGDAEHVLALYGPRAPAVLAELGVSVPVDAYGHAAVTVLGSTVQIVRVPAPGAGGFLCRLASEDGARWWRACLAAAAVVPVGAEALETLRVESGVPRYGHDVGSDTLALEAPFSDAINFGKGCYLGQEVVERVTARGHVNRKLAGLLVAGADVPATGDRLWVGEREVGWLTSTAWSWALGRPVALGYVRREHLAPGTEVEIRASTGPATATVAAFPLV
jgi:folate-binding protein YgfZ